MKYKGVVIMNEKQRKLIEQWQAEERIAKIHGWDFSHIDGRFTEVQDLPWDYREIIARYLRPEMKLLDVDTGGGEFLLSLGHPNSNTAATEAYPPNVELCAKTLIPLGIDFREGRVPERLPFEDERFDMVIDRHGDINACEFYRVLRPGGIFVTQQVGAENDRELAELLLGEARVPFPEQYVENISAQLRAAGFDILQSQEHFGSIAFSDIGALVWFARIIEWEFPGFSVNNCTQRLLMAQEQLESSGSIRGRTHRFLIAARKQ